MFTVLISEFKFYHVQKKPYFKPHFGRLPTVIISTHPLTKFNSFFLNSFIKLPWEEAEIVKWSGSLPHAPVLALNTGKKASS